MKTAAKLLSAIIGIIIGYQTSYFLIENGILSKLINKTITSPYDYIISSVFAAICGLILLFLTPYIIDTVNKISKNLLKKLKSYSVWDLVLGIAGLIVALVIAMLLSIPINNITIPDILKNVIIILIYIVLIYVLVSLATLKRSEIQNLFKSISEKDKEKEPKKNKHDLKIKILDTSAIIDGRILDIFKSGFIEGVLVIPEFVLSELRHVADSADDLKRQRGRRGLDILGRIQTELNLEVRVVDKDYQQIDEVDVKLVKLAFDMGGKIITNDFNLNKIAQFQGVSVLNVNELANAVKTILLPGEEMEILIIKEGKENNQGIGYLDDGTMIVVQGGKKYIGENKSIMVTSVLQTAAGRMVFAKPK